MAVPLVLLVACAPETQPDAMPVTPWVYDPDPAPAPRVGPDAVTAELGGVLDEVRRLDPRLAFDAYDGALRHGDGECPVFDPDHLPQQYWEDDCATADGSTFYGWALSQHDRNVPTPDGFCPDFAFYFGFSRIVGADGAAWDGWGQLAWSECLDHDTAAATLSADYEGNFVDDGDSWLADALALDLTVKATADGDARTLTISGGLSGLPGGLFGAWFDGFALSNTSACPAEPSGSITAWDDLDVAYIVTFDGPDDPACDGCGALTIAGEDAGVACIDTSPLIGWSERPWE
jgi:hypothetical protein